MDSTRSLLLCWLLSILLKKLAIKLIDKFLNSKFNCNATAKIKNTIFVVVFGTSIFWPAECKHIIFYYF